MSVVSEFDVRSFMYLDGRSVRDWKLETPPTMKSTALG